MRKRQKRLFEITARLVIEGAHMEVEAISEEAALLEAEENPDFDLSAGETVELKITKVKQQY